MEESAVDLITSSLGGLVLRDASRSSSAAPAAPVALNEDSLPEDLVCTICMSLPVDPVITPCHHIFCRGCILQSLSAAGDVCPIDREPCTCDQIGPLRGAISRVWSGIQVKCGRHDNGCAWRGSVGDYASHAQNCSVGRDRGGSVASEEEVESYRARIRHLEEEREQERAARAQQRAQLSQLARGIGAMIPTLDEAYSYNRENVVKLSQLISFSLDSKPQAVDRNRIYNCVRSCYVDLKRGYGDNPEHYHVNVRMLLATCLASNWFSDKQNSSIDRWYQEQFMD